MPHYLGNRGPPSERPVAIKPAAEVGVTGLLVNFTARHRLHGTNLQLSFSCTYSESETDVWLVLFMRETLKIQKEKSMIYISGNPVTGEKAAGPSKRLMAL